jgi:hypothetical protein
MAQSRHAIFPSGDLFKHGLTHQTLVWRSLEAYFLYYLGGVQDMKAMRNLLCFEWG